MTASSINDYNDNTTWLKTAEPNKIKIADHNYKGDATNAKVFHSDKLRTTVATSGYCEFQTNNGDTRGECTLVSEQEMWADILVCKHGGAAAVNAMSKKQLEGIGAPTWNDWLADWDAIKGAPLEEQLEVPVQSVNFCTDAGAMSKAIAQVFSSFLKQSYSSGPSCSIVGSTKPI